MDEERGRLEEEPRSSWNKQRKHFSPRVSGVWEYRPHKRFGIQPESKPERLRGLKHIKAPKGQGEYREPRLRVFPERSRQRGEENDKLCDRVRVVVDPRTGIPVKYRKADAYDLEKAMGKKVKVDSILDRRNGIDYRRPGDKLFSAPDYSTGYYHNAKWGGGVLPGSNFGFARATQTTREGQRVFGKSLGELWNKSPSIPLPVSLCLDFLEAPEVLAAPQRLFCNAMFEYHDEEPAGGHSLPESVADQLRKQQHGSDKGAIEEAQLAREARKKEIRVMRKKLDAGQGASINLAGCDPRIVLGLLIRFFREMKPALLTYDLYEKIMQTQLEPLPQARVESLRAALGMLPPPNETVLFRLVCYLNQLVNHPSEPVAVRLLAEVFSPVILRDDPRRPTLDILQDESRKKMLQESVVACMLSNAQQVFPASALRAKQKRAHLPFNLRRTISLAVQDFDSVVDLDAWEDQVDLCDSSRLDSSRVEQQQQEEEKRQQDDEQEEQAYAGTDEEKDELDELEQLIRNYRISD